MCARNTGHKIFSKWRRDSLVIILGACILRARVHAGGASQVLIILGACILCARVHAGGASQVLIIQVHAIMCTCACRSRGV